MKKIIKIDIVDNNCDYNERLQDTFYLIEPNADKLNELKNMIENRFNYQYAENLTDEEIEKAEKFCDNIWDEIYKFISINFEVLEIETREIEY